MSSENGDSLRGRKIVVFRERLLPGSETFVRNHVDSLSTTEWRVQLVGLTNVKSPLSRKGDVKLLEGLRKYRRVLYSAVRWDPRIERWFSSNRPSLVHVHFGTGAVKILPTLRRKNIPLVVSFHGVDVNVMPARSNLRGFIYRRRLKSLFSYSDSLVANSKFLAGELSKLGAPIEKIVIIPPQLSLETLKSARVDGPRNGVLFVGRLTQVKGVQDAIRAYEQLPRRIKESHPFTIVGDGLLREELVALANSLSINVHFLGQQSPKEIQMLMDSSAVLLNPSKAAPDGAVESFGVIFAEAAAASLPVVSYVSGGIPETVIHGTTGLLAPEGDIAILSDYLRQLLMDPERSRQMGDAAREKIVKDYLAKDLTALLLSVYERATCA